MKELIDEVLDFKTQGLSYRQTADKIGIPKSTAHDLLLDRQVSERETVSFSDTQKSTRKGGVSSLYARDLCHPKKEGTYSTVPKEDAGITAHGKEEVSKDVNEDSRHLNRLLSVEAAAEYLGLSPRTLYNRIGRKAKNPFPVRPKRVGRLVKFDRLQLDQWIDSL